MKYSEQYYKKKLDRAKWWKEHWSDLVMYPLGIIFGTIGILFILRLLCFLIVKVGSMPL